MLEINKWRLGINRLTKSQSQTTPSEAQSDQNQILTTKEHTMSTQSALPIATKHAPNATISYPLPDIDAVIDAMTNGRTESRPASALSTTSVISQQVVYLEHNYRMFKPDPTNRVTTSRGAAKNNLVYKDMKENGFRIASPIIVKPMDKDGKFEITDGHNRFTCAQLLGIRVAYMIDSTCTPAVVLANTSTGFSSEHYIYKWFSMSKDPNAPQYIKDKHYHYGMLEYYMAKVSTLGFADRAKQTWVARALTDKITGRPGSHEVGEFVTSDEAIKRMEHLLTVFTYLGMSTEDSKGRVTGKINLKTHGFLTSHAALQVLLCLVSHPNFDAHAFGVSLATNLSELVRKGNRNDYLTLFTRFYKGHKGGVSAYDLKQHAQEVIHTEQGNKDNTWWTKN